MTVQELKHLRESEDKVEFKKAKTQFAYDSGRKSGSWLKSVEMLYLCRKKDET
jgi:hypothetical protein